MLDKNGKLVGGFWWGAKDKSKRIPPRGMLGKHHSLKAKIKIGEASDGNKNTLGKRWKLSKETIEKQQKARAKLLKDPRFIAKKSRVMGSYWDTLPTKDYKARCEAARKGHAHEVGKPGRKHTDSVKGVLSLLSQIRWEDPVYIKRMKKLGKKRWNNKKFRTNILNKIRAKFWDCPNKLELAMIDILDSIDVPYIFQGIVARYIPDFVLIDYNLVIECDGEYWHRNGKRDKLKDKRYKKAGYNVLRFSYTQVMKYTDWVEDQIEREITRICLS